ncbi:hypothetical protein BH24ACI5_BH24ACI5_23770 [soil metagenome]
MAENVYFDLTRVFNDRGAIVALASGQAVVHYRIAIMSKDRDWVIRETAEACARVLDVLARRGASYRPGAPLDPQWLAGGWSSHFEYTDERGRRVRCDFFSRPPRVSAAAIDRLFAAARDRFLVVDVESLIRMKQTQRAKDYAVIGELATRLPPALELLVTTDPDRLLDLARRPAPMCGVPPYARQDVRPRDRQFHQGDLVGTGRLTNAHVRVVGERILADQRGFPVTGRQARGFAQGGESGSKRKRRPFETLQHIALLLMEQMLR